MSSPVNDTANDIVVAIECRSYPEHVEAKLNSLIQELGGVYLYDQPLESKLLYALALFIKRQS